MHALLREAHCKFLIPTTVRFGVTFYRFVGLVRQLKIFRNEYQKMLRVDNCCINHHAKY